MLQALISSLTTFLFAFYYRATGAYAHDTCIAGYACRQRGIIIHPEHVCYTCLHGSQRKE